MKYKKFAQITCSLLVTTFINQPILHSDETRDYTVVMELPTDNFILDQKTGKFTVPQQAAAQSTNNHISYVPPIYGDHNAPPMGSSREYTVVMELPADQFTYDQKTGKYAAIQKPYTAPPLNLNQPSPAPLANFNPRYNQQSLATPCQTIEACHSYKPQETACSEASGTFRAGLEFAGGRFIALDQNYGGVTFFAVPQSSIGGIHPLIDIRGFKLERKNWAGSAGLGFRKFNAEERKVYGVNFFYDYRNQKNQSYHQWGFGLEVLSGCWEFHLNGYMPVGKTDNEISKWCQQFDDGFFAIYRKNEFALRGLELTGGGRWCLFDNLALYIAPGFYIYNNNDIGNIQGIQCNADISWNDWLSFRLNASYDSKFKGRVQGIFELNIPLNFGSCPSECAYCESYLGRPIRRNDMIFFKRCTSIERNFDDCGLRNCSIR